MFQANFTWIKTKLETCQNFGSSPLIAVLGRVVEFLLQVKTTVANKLPAIPQFLLRHRSQRWSQHGGDQEEDAGDEGGEGQRLRQGRRLRGAVQGCQGRWLSCKNFFEDYQDVFFKLRASKAEGEVEELTNKARQLETELDLTKENLGIATLKVATSKRIISIS